MKANQIIQVALRYEYSLAKKNVIAERQDMSSTQVTSAQRLSHIKWMCKEIQVWLKNDHFEVDKAERWICFVQGVLWCEGLRSIDNMRDDNR
jgi:hypothetical protein